MKRRVLVEHGLTILLAPLAALCLVAWSPLGSLVPLALDGIMRAGSAWPPPLASSVPDPVIVAMDTRSLNAFHDWPWPRSRYAELIDRLEAADVAAIAFDIDFSTPRDPVHDARFAQAIERSGRVVLGAFREIQEIEGAGQLEIVLWPVPELARHATLGSGMVPFDPDGTVRRARPVARVGQARLPSLASATLGVVTREPAALGDDRLKRIDFRRAQPPIPVFALADVLEGHVADDALRGRAVFVGATAPVLQDLWTTPVEARMPGVIIHAIEYRNHAAERAGHPPLTRVSLGAKLFVLFAFSLLMRALGSGGHGRRIAGAVLGVAATPTVSLGALSLGHVLIEPLSPLLVVLLHYLAGLERVRVHIRRRLHAREQSIGALVRIGKLASGEPGAQSHLALQLLGETTHAHWLVLAPARLAGELAPVEEAPCWTRSGRDATPRLDRAREALAAGEVRLLDDAEQSEHELYVPLATGGQQIGVLIAGYPFGTKPDRAEIDTVEAVAALIALASTTDRLIHDLRSASLAAQAASRAKTEFLANMSHEIRTPLNAVIGYTDLLRDPSLPESEREQMTDAVRLNGEHVVTLVGDILDLSRIETGKFDLEKRPFDLAALLEELERMVGDRAREKGLQLDFVRGAALPESIEGDAARLRQVLLNLLGNGIKFTDRGFVRLRAGTDDGSDVAQGRLRLSVEDSGIGIAPEAREQVFEAFFQADASTTRARGGTGLGLAISRQLIERMGGSIELHSEPGRGSTFTVTLPIGERKPKAKPRAKKPASPATTLSGRVLVAEDGVDNQRIVRMFLKKAGLDVTIAENGRIALETALAAAESGEGFDLVFMDIAMPEMDGHEATRALRDAGFTAPIVALTAHALPEDREAALAAGCDDFMTKPIQRPTLIEMAARHLQADKRGETD